MLRRVLQRMEPTLSRMYRKATEPPVPNLKGDRSIEFSWVVAHMPSGPGHALDFGCGESYLGLVAARRGYQVTCVDLLPVTWYYQHPGLTFVQGDILVLAPPAEQYDLIINCSSIEHVGLAGRYGVTTPREDGDIEAMASLRGVLKPGKLMLLTIPVGRDHVFTPLHRVYGAERLPRLLEGWEIGEREYWTKDASNRWASVEEAVALGREPTEHCYGLGLFVLRRPA